MPSEPLYTSYQLYLQDLHEFGVLSREEEDRLVEQARAGDRAAKERVIIACLPFVWRTATTMARAYMRTGDLGDLIQIGNLALVEHIDKVLARGKGLAYLCAIARKIIRWDCLYHSRGMNLDRSKGVPTAEERPIVESVEVLQEAEDDTWMYAEHLITGTEQPAEPATNALYNGSLQAALEALPPRQREVVVRHYGLDGGTTEPLVDIGKQLPIKPGSNAAYVAYYKAIQRLREQLKKA